MGVAALCMLGAGCAVTAATEENPGVEDHDPRPSMTPYEPSAPVRITSIAPGDWDISTNPRLKWKANPDVIGSVRFVSVRIFEVIDGRASDNPCVTIDDTTGALARANGCPLFEPMDGVLVCFMGSHAGMTELKHATEYVLALRLVGSSEGATCTVRFTTR
ncbi:MAG: hypothetical protein DRP79_07930 [Planctomycetota bacterium]|nr:MAG: hypothetical protein DRP79_07930 [Planctomycetota bacterium]